jgi:hypothetical protein
MKNVIVFAKTSVWLFDDRSLYSCSSTLSNSLVHREINPNALFCPLHRMGADLMMDCSLTHLAAEDDHAYFPNRATACRCQNVLHKPALAKRTE